MCTLTLKSTQLTIFEVFAAAALCQLNHMVEDHDYASFFQAVALDWRCFLGWRREECFAQVRKHVIGKDWPWLGHCLHALERAVQRQSEQLGRLHLLEQTRQHFALQHRDGKLRDDGWQAAQKLRLLLAGLGGKRLKEMDGRDQDVIEELGALQLTCADALLRVICEQPRQHFGQQQVWQRLLGEKVVPAGRDRAAGREETFVCRDAGRRLQRALVRFVVYRENYQAEREEVSSRQHAGGHDKVGRGVVEVQLHSAR